jgi:predicted HTH transcriptional regulator
MTRLSEQELGRLIQGGETNTVELKVATPRPVEMAERLYGMANAQGGVIICQRLSKKSDIFPIVNHRF